MTDNQDEALSIPQILKMAVMKDIQFRNNTLLSYAIELKNLPTVVALVETHGFNVNSINQSDSLSPLQVCFKSEQLDIADYLLSHGALPDLAAQGTRNAIQMAILSRNYDALALLQRHGADFEAPASDYMALSVKYHPTNVSMVDRLADLGVNINSASGLGKKTALIIACELKATATVARLLERGAIVDAVDEGRRTPLMRASEAGSLDIVRILCEQAHANVHHTSLSGSTALIVAAEKGRHHVVDYLLGQGADVNAQTLRGNTALNAAVLGGHVATVELLLERGAFPDPVDASGETPLFHVSEIVMAGLLLRFGCDPSHKSLNGSSPREHHTPYRKGVSALINGYTPVVWTRGDHVKFPFVFKKAVFCLLCLWSWNYDRGEPWHPEGSVHILSVIRSS